MSSSELPSSELPPTELNIPALSLVVLIGASDETRRQFAEQHFAPEEVCTDPEQAEGRLSRGLLTVLDAPHLTIQSRSHAVALARANDVQAVALVLDPPLPHADPQTRADLTDLHRELGGPDAPSLRVEGFRIICRLRSQHELDSVQLRRVPLPPDRRELTGPFDVIGDVHGCLSELVELLKLLGYTVSGALEVTPPAGRTAVFLGDLTDRGPDSPGVLRLIMGMVAAGSGLCVQGNHDAKLLRVLQGHSVKVTHGLEITLSQMGLQPPAFSEQVQRFLAALPSHLVLDTGKLVAAHAGLPAHLQGRDSRRVWAFALYGEVDRSAQAEGGQPVRLDWAATYGGSALVTYGHTPVALPRWKNHTVNLDTGCVYGSQLSALRYPELETVGVQARAAYREAKDQSGG
jgi:diadenosine tetraphosphatase ApaH/serine/threonine PP2A family protein phosphatase/predicted kinase